MATKKILVDLEAYNHLCRAKRSEKESFSQVIRRAIWRPKKGTCAQLLAEIHAEESTAGSHGDVDLGNLDQWQEDDSAAPDRWADAGQLQ